MLIFEGLVTPMLIDQALAIAVEHHRAGQLQQAEAIYRQILAQDPNHAGALHLLGVIANQVGQHDTAIDLIGRAIALEPRLSDAHNNLGLAFKATGRLNEALACCHRALALKPDFPEAHYNLGNVLRAKGQLDAATACYQRALVLRPDLPEAHNNLGDVLQEQGQLDAAMASCQRALELKPDLSEAHNNLGNVFQKKGQFDEAMASYQRALALKPDYAEAQSNLGTILQQKGQFNEAMACYRRALAFKPDHPESHNNLAACLLTLGDFEAGWREYEWRWQTNEFRPLRRQFTAPRWDGSELSGRTILLHAEQGFGDTLQFLRYIKLVAQRGGRIILESPPELFRLLHNLPHVEQLFSRGQSLPAFDLHCPLLSLPLIMNTTLESIPVSVPYLAAPAALVEQWRQRLPREDGLLKVGLVWKGRTQRTLPSQALAPLAEIRGVWFCSLQKEAADSKSPTPPGLTLADWTGELLDFADTAALIANLDLVVTVDTAVAHLAGALGKPVWVLLEYAAEWRWMLQRTDSPWYPTMRLFRQTTPGDWPTVVETIVTALKSQEF